MKESEVFLEAIGQGLKSLAKSLEIIGEKMEELAEAEREEKAAAEPGEKKIALKAQEKEARAEERRVTAAQAVLGVIKASRKGVNTARLEEMTGFNEKKIRNVIYKLKNEGKIKSERRGIYTKA